MPDPHSLREAAAHRGVAGLEEATAHVPRARRNLLVGLWSGRRMGLSDRSLALHAAAVMEADHDEVGDADVCRALAAGFAGAGLSVPDAEIRAELVAAQRRAYEETLAHQH